VRQHTVVLSPDSVLDLQLIYDWLEAEAGDAIAANYIKRIRAFIQKLEFAPMRGQNYEHLRKGLRSIGFERRVTIIFNVEDSTVEILRIFYGGQNWQAAFDEEV
jgi:toxin ParE1/3/4